MLIYDLPRRMNNKGEVKNLTGKNIDGQKNCRVPWTSLYIDFDGAIKGHCCCTEKIAEKDSDLLEIWNGNIMQEYRNEMKNGGFSHYFGNQCTQYGFFDVYL